MRAFQNKSTPPHGTRVSFLAVALHRETSSIVSLLVVMKRRQGVHAKARNEQSSRKTLRTQRRADLAVTGASAVGCKCRSAGWRGRLQGIDPQGKALPQAQTASQHLPPDPIRSRSRGEGRGSPARRRLHVLLLCLGQMLQPLVYLLGRHGLGRLLTRRVRPPRYQQNTRNGRLRNATEEAGRGAYGKRRTQTSCGEAGMTEMGGMKGRRGRS